MTDPSPVLVPAFEPVRVADVPVVQAATLRSVALVREGLPGLRVSRA